METLSLSKISKRYEGKDKIIQVDVDPNKRISKIAFALSLCDSIIAIKCYDGNGKLFVHKNWWENRGVFSEVEDHGGM